MENSGMKRPLQSGETTIDFRRTNWFLILWRGAASSSPNAQPSGCVR